MSNLVTSRKKLAGILHTASQAVHCIEKAEETEGHTASTKSARTDLANLFRRLASVTDLDPNEDSTVAALVGFEAELENFPK
jgi:hypothetical protein